MRELAPQYPRDYLLPLEEGNLLRALGRNQESAAAYRKVLQTGREGKYGNLHYEMAALGLGDLLRSQKDYIGAVAAYEQVNDVAQPDPEVLQKSNLAAGEMYDLLQKRDLALKKYQAAVAVNGGSRQAETARKLMKDPYRGG